jgi:hypothetical protein
MIKNNYGFGPKIGDIAYSMIYFILSSCVYGLPLYVLSGLPVGGRQVASYRVNGQTSEHGCAVGTQNLRLRLLSF